MRINDKDIKNLVLDVSSIKGDMKVISERLSNIDEHLAMQNSRLNKHAGNIQGNCNDITDLKVRIWLIGVIGAGAGGLLGTIFGVAIKSLIFGG